MKLALVPSDAAILGERMPEFRGKPSDLGALARAMLEVCRAHEGVGLAAPQVGIRQRLFVLDLSAHTKPGESARAICINPVLLQQAGKPIIEDEGCLTWPGQRTSMLRPEIIVARFTDTSGRQRTRRMTMLWARAFLHELDHLEGRTIFPRADGSAQPRGIT